MKPPCPLARGTANKKANKAKARADAKNFKLNTTFAKLKVDSKFKM